MKTTSADLQGVTELTLIIPVKTGLVESLGTTTYTLRLLTLLKLLGGLRKNSQDVYRVKPFSDTVERIQFIHSFRLALLGSQKLMLAVAFDGPWEPYMRAIWRDLGPLLDVIMCNCEGYPISAVSSFSEYDRWIRRHQVSSQFFYIQSATTVSDVSFLRNSEKKSREIADPAIREMALATNTMRCPEQEALKVARNHSDMLMDQGLKALDSLSQLRRYYTSGLKGTSASSDDTVLLRAGREILKELVVYGTDRIPQTLRQLYGKDLLWFEQQPMSEPCDDTQAKERKNKLQKSKVQGGILENYADANLGCLLLFKVESSEEALAFFKRLQINNASRKTDRDAVYINLALTYQGMKSLGMDESQLDLFPEEFRLGMEQRARLLGDVYENHPSNWALPKMNWVDDQRGGAVGEELQLSIVDFVIQLRTPKPCRTNPHQILDNPAHPLWPQVKKLAKTKGVSLLHVQAMLSRDLGVFGFKDGLSQPALDKQPKRQYWKDEVSPGEIFLGYENDRDQHCPDKRETPALLKNGSYMVVRKIQQNIHAMEDFLQQHKPALTQAGLKGDDLKAKMMGRYPGSDAKPLVSPSHVNGDNDFNFDDDKGGYHTPLQSHIRRANPRDHKLNNPVPRIIRRGMSYGPSAGQRENDCEERGLMFLAYNSSITNQFEQIQRWISGGNSSQGYSGEADPFLSIPNADEKRTFRCVMGDKVMRFDIDGNERRLLTRLQWGLYLFVPSMDAIKNGLYIRPQRADASPLPTQAQMPDLLVIYSELVKSGISSEQRVTFIIHTIQSIRGEGAEKIKLQAWKIVLEDRTLKESGLTGEIWAFVRKKGGVLDTEFGLLVGSVKNMELVLGNEDVFSVEKALGNEGDCYLNRMQKSLGPIFLGLDQGEQYRQQSDAINSAIMAVTKDDAFALCKQITTKQILETKAIKGAPCQLSMVSLVDQVLAELCQHWFDVPDGQLIQAGGQPYAADDRSLHCPAHYIAPSRAIFSPNPEPYTAVAGQRSGQALQMATLGLMQRGFPFNGILSKAVMETELTSEQKASALVGIMLGFLPTTYGNLLTILKFWIESKSLWRLQQSYLAQGNYALTGVQKSFESALLSTMQLDPTPEMIWRTAIKDFDQWGIKKGKKVVLSVTSAAQDLKQRGKLDVFPAFGGDRRIKAAATHACPGYDMAIGVLLGFMAAVMESGTLRPTQNPLIVELR